LDIKKNYCGGSFVKAMKKIDLILEWFWDWELGNIGCGG
jgi:hypothetical protein